MNKLTLDDVEWYYDSVGKIGYEAKWDAAYALIRHRDYEAWHRFPEVLAPEYTPAWFWRKVYPLVYQLRLAIWFSRPVQAMWNGYKIHPLDWVQTTSPRGYPMRKQVSTRTPLWLQHKLAWLAKHSARCWGIGHALEAMAIGDRWGWYCPHCGYQHSEDMFFNDWYKFTHGGTTFTGEYTQHWFEGFFDCPRCLRRWDYGDSD